MPHNSMLDLRKNTEKGSGIFATLNDKHPVDHRYKHNYLSQNKRQNNRSWTKPDKICIWIRHTCIFLLGFGLELDFCGDVPIRWVLSLPVLWNLECHISYRIHLIDCRNHLIYSISVWFNQRVRLLLLLLKGI